MGLSVRARGQVRALATLAGLLAVSGRVEASPPLDPPKQYRARAAGAMTVSGPHCCGRTRFTGRMEAYYAIGSSGAVVLSGLSFVLDDTDVVVHGGFLDLFTERIRLRCAAVSNRAAAAGFFDGVDRIDFPPGALDLSGGAADSRLPDGACTETTLVLEAANDVTASLRHDPARNRFSLLGTFRSVVEGDTYVFDLDAAGTFDNRPPVAALAVETSEVPQGGCPASWRWSGQGWEAVAEANDPNGLVGTLRSVSSDPDPPGGRGDVLADRWFRTRDAGPREHAGDAYRTPPVVFEWGPVHRVELLSLDHQAASDAAECSFRVIDTRPPVVTPPPPATLGCTQPGGASPSTSAELEAFLSGASARDLGDGAPAALPPTVGGAAVSPSTLFPVDGVARTVAFRFKDRFTNVGRADSQVTVVDVTPPSLEVALSPASLPGNEKFWWITATLRASDDCGGALRFKLAKITSNAPALDASDILDASYGADDRGFFLFSRPAAPGVPRVYTVVYQAIDGAGNVMTAAAQLVVG